MNDLQSSETLSIVMNGMVLAVVVGMIWLRRRPDVHSFVQRLTHSFGGVHTDLFMIAILFGLNASAFMAGVLIACGLGFYLRARFKGASVGQALRFLQGRALVDGSPIVHPEFVPLARR